MKNAKLVYLCLTAATFAGGMAKADWNPGDGHKMHYPQLPDLTPSGIDVNATWKYPFTNPAAPLPYSKILADDFRCSETGPINDIHIWGSWLNDQVYSGVEFKLSIHSDVPAVSGIPGSYSHPGPELWKAFFLPGSYLPRPVGTGATERFWDPNTNQFGTDHEVWQYNFTNIPNPFVQEQGKIYWLDVQAFVPDSFPGAFGWKTTNPSDPRTPHFMDDAVYGDTQFFGGPPIPQFPNPNPNDPIGPLPWHDLIYPIGQYEFQSMDLAFVITPEPVSLAGFAIAGVLLMRRR